MKVKDILKTKKRANEILQVRISDSLAQAIAVMVENDTGSALVYDGGEFAGMVTFREVLSTLHKNGAAALTAPVRECMIVDAGCGSPDDSIDQIRRLMTSRHIRYLPIVDNAQVIGVISFYDVARAVAKDVNFENRMLKEYIRDWPGAA